MRALAAIALLLQASTASAAVLRCEGDLRIADEKNRVRSAAEVRLTPQNSGKFTVLDRNERELARIWPWMTIETRTLITPVESRERRFELVTNGIDRFSIAVDSSSSKAREHLYCEVSEDP